MANFVGLYAGKFTNTLSNGRYSVRADVSDTRIMIDKTQKYRIEPIYIVYLYLYLYQYDIYANRLIFNPISRYLPFTICNNTQS